MDAARTGVRSRGNGTSGRLLHALVNRPCMCYVAHLSAVPGRVRSDFAPVACVIIVWGGGRPGSRNAEVGRRRFCLLMIDRNGTVNRQRKSQRKIERNPDPIAENSGSAVRSAACHIQRSRTGRRAGRRDRAQHLYLLALSSLRLTHSLCVTVTHTRVLSSVPPVHAYRHTTSTPLNHSQGSGVRTAITIAPPHRTAASHTAISCSWCRWAFARVSEHAHPCTQQHTRARACPQIPWSLNSPLAQRSLSRLYSPVPRYLAPSLAQVRLSLDPRGERMPPPPF